MFKVPTFQYVSDFDRSLKRIGACFDTLQHERILVNNFNTHSVRPEHGRRTPNGFQQSVEHWTLNLELKTR
jgi:hypothetical protein